MLVVTTTHLKEAYIRRSGLMRSDKATVRTGWRMIGDYLQATSILYDPVYQAEPYVRSTMMWRRDPAMLLRRIRAKRRRRRRSRAAAWRISCLARAPCLD